MKGGEQQTMAILTDVIVQMVYQAGVNDKGLDVYKSQSYSMANIESTDQQLLDFTAAYDALTTRDFVEVTKTTKSTIS